jgi:hypothetical protein
MTGIRGRVDFDLQLGPKKHRLGSERPNHQDGEIQAGDDQEQMPCQGLDMFHRTAESLPAAPAGVTLGPKLWSGPILAQP